MINFKIVVVGGPADDYVEKCLKSIIVQDNTNWRAQVILDPADDLTYRKASRYASDILGVKINKKRLYAIPNIIKAIELLKPKDNDVIVFVDADDWLYSENVLSIVESYYESSPYVLVTHGSWVGFPSNNMPNNSEPYRDRDFVVGIRNSYWRGTALRTMKYKVWKRIKDSDLRDQNSRYFKSAWDVAIMFPAIEMAGIGRIRHIPEPLYVYNKETPFSDDKLRLEEQRKNKEYICNMKPYQYCYDL